MDRSSTVSPEIYESATSEGSVAEDIARKIGKSEEHEAVLCHEFNLRVARSEATFEEWASFLRYLYRKFNRFIDIRFNLVMLSEVLNLIFMGKSIYGEERLWPLLRHLGISVYFYLDDNGEHSIAQLSTQSFEGTALPENDPVFHFLPYRHGSLQDITERVGTMLSTINRVEEKDGVVCPILCYNEFAVEGSDSLKLGCNHIFHSACITPWLVLNPTCPTCRRRAFSDL